MTLTLGHVAVTDSAERRETGGERRGMQVANSDVLPFADALGLAQQIVGLRGTKILPVTVDDDPHLDGFYEAGDAEARVRGLGTEAIVDWQVSLTRVLSDRGGHPEFESWLLGSQLVNAHGQTQSRWHAPPHQADTYTLALSLTVPTVITRTGEHGSHTVYVGIGADQPRWTADPASYLAGGCVIRSGGFVATGMDCPDDPLGWELDNGLVRVSWSAQDRLIVESWAAGGWRRKAWVLHPGKTRTPWNRVQVLTNRPELVSLRLVDADDPGRSVLDLTLRRGSRFVSGNLRKTSLGSTMQVFAATTEAPEPLTGVVRANVDDADGNRMCIGSSQSFTPHPTTVGVARFDVAELDFFVGVEVGGAAAQQHDRATQLLRQYLGYVAERTVVARR